MIRIIVLIGVGLASGCVGDSESSSEETLQIEACHGRETDAVDAFTLSSVTRSGDDLLVNVQADGGCKLHRFAVCWDGLSRSSYPPQMDLKLTHDAHDPCRAQLEFQLRIDTSGFFGGGGSPMVVRIIGHRNEDELFEPVTLFD